MLERERDIYIQMHAILLLICLSIFAIYAHDVQRSTYFANFGICASNDPDIIAQVLP